MRYALDIRRSFVVILVIALAAGVLSMSVGASDQPLAGKIVALDPGHFETATDTGAINSRVSPTLIERDVNWEVVLATKANLEALGATVVLTREEGQYLDRPTRYAIANAAGAQVLVSVHHNGSTDPAVNYTATFYTQPTDKAIASVTYQHLTAALGFTSGGGIWRDAFGMTVKPKMPSTLTEAWFITNDATAQRYVLEASQRTSQTPGEGWGTSSLVVREAQALTDAIISFLSSAGGGKGKPR